MANKWSPSTPSPVGGGIIEASVARHPGCSWRVFSPAGFHSLGCPAQERYFVDFGARGDVEDGALPPRLPSIHRLLTHTSSTSGDCERSSIMARKSSPSTPSPVGGGIMVASIARRTSCSWRVFSPALDFTPWAAPHKRDISRTSVQGGM